MAELASGAVSSLLGLLRNEALLLSRVAPDVEFIKEEMESMHSFLEHLARTAPPAGGHDEQVRTWMKQVRDLAYDCSNCIDLYLRRGDPAFYHASGGRWRYLWWAKWLVQKMVAQHSMAIRLGELKERARDVGKRRLRYGVEIPRKEAGGAGPSMPSSSQAEAAAAAAEDDNDDQNQVAAAVATGSDPRQRALEPRALEEYCAEKLVNWLNIQGETQMEESMPSIAIVAPDDMENTAAVALESLTLATTHFTCTLWINLCKVHFPWNLPLVSGEILLYILRGCEKQQGTAQSEAEGTNPQMQAYCYKDGLDDGISNFQMEAYRYKENLAYGIWNIIDKEIKVEDKIEEIKKKIGEVDIKKVDETKRSTTKVDKRIRLLLHALRLGQNSPEANVPLSWEEPMEEIAWRLKIHMESGETGPPIRLEVTQYKVILRKVFPDVANKPLRLQAQERATASSATTLGEDHIKEMIESTVQGIIRDLLPKLQLVEAATSAGKEHDATGTQLQVKETTEKKEISGEVKATTSAIATAVNETREKMDEIMMKIWSQLLIQGIVDKIKPHLENKKTLIILQDDEDYISTKADDEDNVSTWEETRNALKLLGCAAGSAVIVFTKKSQKAKEFCCPAREPITCSLVGLYHDTVLQLTQQQQVDNGNYGYISQILRDILHKCHPHEFCMEIFTRALYANPNRSYEELQRLCGDLVPQKILGSNAKKVLKFSYKDLPREYKTCLLYLAIFPQGHNIRRSTLIGRWVTEGLITKQDWRTAVYHAERCFDALIIRGFVLPCDIGAAGKVKSCWVGDQVHGFITKIATKEHILDARLSDLWARHFSIFSGLRLRTTDSIEKFVHKLSKYSPQLSLLKVLDLEGANCFDKNRYLKDICNKLLLLKYLSLRCTNVNYLPNEINNLHELEVLDIRQTMLPESATRDVLLLKLRRLLAGHVDPSLEMNGKLCSTVQIPCKIEKMENLEVLSNVKASRDGREFKDIRNIYQLRKLGVVIEDRDNHLMTLLRAISDLKDCLQSLSITISSNTRRKSTTSSKERQPIDSWLIQTPKYLESLSINGVTQRGQLLEPLAKGSDELVKVTLSGTLLKEENLMVLSVLPKLHCLRLNSNAYTESKLTFKKGGFPQLTYFLVRGTNNTETDIKFEDGATAELEKINLSSTNIRYLSGIGNLPKLKELELEGNQSLLSISQDGASYEENTDNRAAEQNPERRGTAAEDNSQSIAPEQSSETRASEQNTETTAPEKNNETRAPEQNSETRAAEGITQNGIPEQNVDSRAPEQNNESRAAEGITQSTTPKQNSEIRAIDQNTENRAVDQSTETESKAVKENTQIKAPEQNPESRVAELNSQGRAPEKITESRFIFKKEEFQHLKYFRLKEAKMTNIIFENGAAPELNKIALSLDDKRSQLRGVSDLPKLKEIELRGDKFLLSLFDKADHISKADQISKVILYDTQLKQEDVQILAKKPNLRCLELLDRSYDESQLTFREEFPELDHLTVGCPSINSISFTSGSAPKLKKIVWTFAEMKCLLGIPNLPKLKAIECIGDLVPHQLRKDIAAHKEQPVLIHKKPQQPGQAKEISAADEDDDTRFPLIPRFMKIRNLC